MTSKTSQLLTLVISGFLLNTIASAKDQAIIPTFASHGDAAETSRIYIIQKKSDTEKTRDYENCKQRLADKPETNAQDCEYQKQDKTIEFMVENDCLSIKYSEKEYERRRSKDYACIGINNLEYPIEPISLKQHNIRAPKSLNYYLKHPPLIGKYKGNNIVVEVKKIGKPILGCKSEFQEISQKVQVTIILNKKKTIINATVSYTYIRG